MGVRELSVFNGVVVISGCGSFGEEVIKTDIGWGILKEDGSGGGFGCESRLKTLCTMGRGSWGFHSFDRL
jgi:hypothetical protein